MIICICSNAIAWVQTVIKVLLSQNPKAQENPQPSFSRVTSFLCRIPRVKVSPAVTGVAIQHAKQPSGTNIIFLALVLLPQS